MEKFNILHLYVFLKITPNPTIPILCWRGAAPKKRAMLHTIVVFISYSLYSTLESHKFLQLWPLRSSMHSDWLLWLIDVQCLRCNIPSTEWGPLQLRENLWHLSHWDPWCQPLASGIPVYEPKLSVMCCELTSWQVQIVLVVNEPATRAEGSKL